MFFADQEARDEVVRLIAHVARGGRLPLTDYQRDLEAELRALEADNLGRIANALECIANELKRLNDRKEHE